MLLVAQVILPLLIFTFGPISGAHFNPMVTACFVATKKMVCPAHLCQESILNTSSYAKTLYVVMLANSGHEPRGSAVAHQTAICTCLRERSCA